MPNLVARYLSLHQKASSEPLSSSIAQLGCSAKLHAGGVITLVVLKPTSPFVLAGEGTTGVVFVSGPKLA